MPSLESLPAELLLNVVEYIPRPSDRKSLCLVCKLLRVPATTLLYQRVVLDNTTPKWTSFKPETGMLFKTNPGLGQIRHVTFDSMSKKVLPEEVQAMTAVLQSLPRNTLRSIDCRRFAVDEKIASLVIAQQRNLISLALGPLTFNLTPFIKLELFGPSTFANVTTLEVPLIIGSLDDLELYQWFIARAPLRRLAIRTELSCNPLPGGLFDSNGSDGLLSRTLFSHLTNDSTAPRAQIEGLGMEYTNLQQATRTFSRFVDFSHLRSLELYDCAGTDVFIDAMAGHFQEHGGCKLEHFAYSIVEEDHISYKVVEKVLRTCEGLKSLMLFGIDDFAHFDLKLFQKHGSSLQALALQPDASEDSDCEEMGLTKGFYSTIAAHCQNLRELALPMPDVQFGIDEPRASQDFDSAMLALLGLPDLKSFRVFNWPVPAKAFPEDTTDDPLLQRDYMLEMDDFAYTHLAKLVNQREQTHSPPILCFAGLSGNKAVYDNEELQLPGPVCYVPLKQGDGFAKPQIGLQKMTLSDVEYVEPEVKILRWPFTLL
ncbi:hypothetical protein M409DRAFT_30095 [Zasmidium cellare ATCC 36951]|uniref:Uncharacterized protein n=1 Tax=Zasmidium cellare ATCC 36951 TaxID=1080233 RepID=A0A6A6BXB5_ZASCE|nr:uncharacterized protein M409DRAFT_30095 [Zasmidium cellare ATCC 36951]KAF2159474.1 hypothetical protein M409DRAFT_30095 [Zasmidium cellare ATCC 36951]